MLRDVKAPEGFIWIYKPEASAFSTLNIDKACCPKLAGFEKGDHSISPLSCRHLASATMESNSLAP